jgi:DDE domain
VRVAATLVSLQPVREPLRCDDLDIWQRDPWQALAGDHHQPLSAITFPSSASPRGHVAGRWRYIYRAVDRFGQVIDVLVSARSDATAARRFFQQAMCAARVTPAEVTTDQAPVHPAVLEEPLPAVWHRTDRYANNRVECDHGRLKARLRPMCGLKQDRSARIVIAGHAFVQSVRRGHYELAAEEPENRRLTVAFDELALAI